MAIITTLSASHVPSGCLAFDNFAAMPVILTDINLKNAWVFAKACWEFLELAALVLFSKKVEIDRFWLSLRVFPPDLACSISMSTKRFYLALSLFTSISQGAPRAFPAPTDPTVHNRYKRSIIPSGAAVVAPLPAPLCVSKNGSNVQTKTKSFALGEQWMPYLPWSEPGQVVLVSTDTSGVEFENIAFDNAPVALNYFTNLLRAYSNSSGWSMTMPSTVNVSGKSPNIFCQSTGDTRS